MSHAADVKAGVERRRANGQPVGRAPTIAPADRGKVTALRAEGWTVRKIAKTIGVGTIGCGR